MPCRSYSITYILQDLLVDNAGERIDLLRASLAFLRVRQTVCPSVMQNASCADYFQDLKLPLLSRHVILTSSSQYDDGHSHNDIAESEVTAAANRNLDMKTQQIRSFSKLQR